MSLDIEDLNYDDLKNGHRQLRAREAELEHHALHTLQHHPWRHALRLIFAGIGFKIPEPQEPHDAPDIQTSVTA